MVNHHGIIAVLWLSWLPSTTSQQQGLTCVLPTELLPIFTPLEMEGLLCGKPHVDVQLLKRVAAYEFVSPTDQHIQWLWEVLEEMSPEDRVKFINFCYARCVRACAECRPRSCFTGSKGRCGRHWRRRVCMRRGGGGASCKYVLVAGLCVIVVEALRAREMMCREHAVSLCGYRIIPHKKKSFTLFSI